MKEVKTIPTLSDGESDAHESPDAHESDAHEISDEGNARKKKESSANLGFYPSRTVLRKALLANENEPVVSELRLLQTFAGVLPWPPGKKIHMRAILKESMANYISLESLINVGFGKKNMNCLFFLIQQK